KFDQATQTILRVLKERPTLVTAQVCAADIYQSRGAQDPQAYSLAINGAEPGPDRKNAIWGWARLSKMASNDWPKFADTFFHSRLKMAEARLRYTQVEKSVKNPGKILEAAKQDLWITFHLHPDLGGAANTARCDTLLKQIQKGLRQQETGLQEFKDPDAAG